MTEAGHTPGQWTVIKGAAEGDDMRCAVVVEHGKMQYLLATIENGAPGDFCETEEANAKLIAAAPDLLAACRALDESAPLDSEYGTCGCCGMRNRHESDCAVILARAAIAKATTP